MAWTKIAVVALVICGAISAVQADETGNSAVMAAEERFYAALNAMFTGDARPMKEVWSHADDVTYMGPGGGFQKGWAAVSDDWDKQAAMKLGGKVTPDRLGMTTGADIAFTQNYEIGENVDKDGRPMKVSIRATNIFRKENGQWKMIGHHTDLLPHVEERMES
jgi:ketosteroid isomerase-like protein